VQAVVSWDSLLLGYALAMVGPGLLCNAPYCSIFHPLTGAMALPLFYCSAA
jgi:hypothetical protein